MIVGRAPFGFSDHSHGVLAAGITAEELSESLDAGQASDDLVALHLVPQSDVQRSPEKLPEQSGAWGERLD